MINIEDVNKIIEKVVQTPIQEFSLEYGTVKLSFRKGEQNESGIIQPGQTEIKQEQVEVTQELTSDLVEIKTVESGSREITSPMVGAFYLSPEPDAAPFVQIGERIEEGSVVGVVEAMKLFNEITADISGEIEEILVQNGQFVEYGQPLFLVRSF